MRNEVTLSDAEIEERFHNCCTVDDLVWTRDTLDDFREARRGYREPGRVRADALTELVVEQCQVAKGHPRQDLHVVDFGPVRAVLML